MSNVKIKIGNLNCCKILITSVHNTMVAFLVIKPTRCTEFSNLFWNETLHVSDSSSVHHQKLFTVHSAMVYVTQTAFEQQQQQDQDGTAGSEWNILILMSYSFVDSFRAAAAAGTS
jgi:hypothetical protein